MQDSEFSNLINKAKASGIDTKELESCWNAQLKAIADIVSISRESDARAIRMQRIINNLINHAKDSNGR
jgi:hypothetical protein